MSVDGRRADLSTEVRRWGRVAGGVLSLGMDGNGWWRLVLSLLLWSRCLHHGWCWDRRSGGMLFDY